MALFEQVLVAGRATAVLGRTGALTREAHRILERSRKSLDRLYQHLVTPPVAEVVDVAEPRAFGGRGSAQRQLPLGLYFVVRLVRLRLAVARAANYELVEMHVAPAHGFLNDHVKSLERDGTGHLNAAPYRRFDCLERDPENVDRILARSDGQAAFRSPCGRGHAAKSLSLV